MGAVSRLVSTRRGESLRDSGRRVGSSSPVLGVPGPCDLARSEIVKRNPCEAMSYDS